MSEAPRKRRRVARFVSEVDRRLIAEGLPPSWEDRVRPEDTRPGSMADSPRPRRWRQRRAPAGQRAPARPGARVGAPGD